VFRGSSYQKAPGTTYPSCTGPADTADRIREALPGVFAGELHTGWELWADVLIRDGWSDPDTAAELVASFQSARTCAT
jgi:hypothetical protein